MIAVQTPPRRATADRPDLRLEQFQARLEASYEFHTERLARLWVAARKNSARKYQGQAFDRDPRALASRQALTAIAAALRAMAEGRYGICEGCDDLIPSERLQQRPEARHCDSCRSGGPADPGVRRRRQSQLVL